MNATYLVNGFMDAGKTAFIKDLLNQDYFNTGERTLIISCEEGEEEYDQEKLQDMNTFVVTIDDQKDFNPENIVEIEKKIRPKRVIVEFNGMWMRNEIEFPWYWEVPVEIAIFDATTFEMYSRNMKSLVAQQVRSAAMVVFNRCDGLIDKLPSYRRNVRAVKTDINVVFMDKDGEMTRRFEEDLPYDISKDEIEITDETYALFYLDAMENLNRYLDKQVTIDAMVMKLPDDDRRSSILGRFVMTCCADDLSVFGFISDFDDNRNLELDDWVRATAIVQQDYAEKYKIWYPVLKIVSYEKIEAPENKIIDQI